MTAAVAFSYALALGATAFVVWHLAQRYAGAPARIPLQIGFDGRPSRVTAGKWILWAAPAVLVVVVPYLGIAMLRTPLPDAAARVIILVHLTIVDIAWLVAWSIDRQIELARDATARIAPRRLLRVISPLLVLVAVTLVVAARSSS